MYVQICSFVLSFHFDILFSSYVLASGVEENDDKHNGVERQKSLAKKDKFYLWRE